jgi:RNA polymerase sigma-32 factor
MLEDLIKLKIQTINQNGSGLTNWKENSSIEHSKITTAFIQFINNKNSKISLKKFYKSLDKCYIEDSANKFRNYGLPTADLVAEGNMGLIQALKKFEPKKGFRFSTYSMWWIRAFIQDYVLRSWSLVKIGTTSAQKKLFFNLGKIKKKLGVQSNEFGLSQEKIKHIAETLNVSSQEVIDMDSRLTQGDSSLNRKIGEDEESIESMDLLADTRPNQEQISIENQQKEQQRNLFKKAFEQLKLREQEIIFKRQLSEDSQTLEELSQHYKVSRERIRQIEESAIKKLKKTIAELIK